MEQTITAREMLAQIEKDFFKGARLAKAILLNGDERRAFRLAQVERLLTEQKGSSPLAMWLSDMFWTADEGRVQMEPVNPLMSLNELQTLTDEEMQRLRLILEIAGLCHDIALHFMFDLKEAFGIRNQRFWASNKRLVEWLTTTAYEHVAMHTAYIMKKHAISVYAGRHYLPAQDELAELFSSEYGTLVRYPSDTRMPPRAYVKTILDELLRIERHWQRGRRLKLEPEVVILHDEIYGLVPNRLDKYALSAAQELYDYMDREVYGNQSAEVLGHFADKVREVRSKYLAKGWLMDGSLEFAYLMEHAQWCSQGCWREEDEAYDE